MKDQVLSIDQMQHLRDLASLHHNYSNKLETLSKLLYLRDIYRNGWKPDWNSSGIKHIRKNNLYFKEGKMLL